MIEHRILEYKMKILGWFNKSREKSEYQYDGRDFSGSVFYVIDKATGDIVNEMGRGKTSSAYKWGEIEEYAMQLIEKLKKQNLLYVPDWMIIAYPCNDITNAYTLNEDYEKIVHLVHSRKPSAVLDLRIAFYAQMHSLEFGRDKVDYGWMDDLWKEWVDEQQLKERADRQEKDFVFVNSVLTDLNNPSQTDMEKMKGIFLKYKDDTEVIEKILQKFLDQAGPARRTRIFEEVEAIVNESDICSGAPFESLECFLSMEAKQMKPVHVLSAELLEATIRKESETESGKKKAEGDLKVLMQVQRMLYHYHKLTGKLTDEDHVFEMEEEISLVLAKWNEYLPTVKEENENDLTVVEESVAAEQPVQASIVKDKYENETTEKSVEQGEASRNPGEFQQEADGNEEKDDKLNGDSSNDASVKPDTGMCMDIEQQTYASLKCLEVGYPLREQIFRYTQYPEITRAQLQWAVSQNFITPTSLVEDGTLVKLIETRYFAEEIGSDLQCISVEGMDEIQKLVCLSYDIFCHRELISASSLFDDFKKQYSLNTIKDDHELTHRYNLLYFMCDILNRRCQAVLEKVSKLRKIQLEQDREEELEKADKMLTILFQEGTIPTLSTMAWDTTVKILSRWKDDGVFLRSFIHIAERKKRNPENRTILESLICHLSGIKEPQKALSSIISGIYEKSQLTLDEYLLLALHHLFIVEHLKWLEQENAKRKEWGRVFDELGQEKTAWANAYIAEYEQSLTAQRNKAAYYDELYEWAEKVVLCRFCEAEDIDFDSLSEKYLPQTEDSGSSSLSNPSRPVKTMNLIKVKTAGGESCLGSSGALSAEEEKMFKEAITNFATSNLPIDTDNEGDECNQEPVYLRSPDGKGYILNGIQVTSKEDYRLISKASSFLTWRMKKKPEEIEAFKLKLTKLRNKVGLSGIQWPDSFITIYNGIINSNSNI